MKKQILISTVAVFSLSGCFGIGSSEANEPEKSVEITTQQQDPNACYEGGVLAPDWLCNPTMEGGLAAVGSAPKNPLGRGFQQTEAMADARDALARQLGTKVKNMFKKFVRTTGVGESQTIEKVATNVSKQIASQDIEGARQVGRWVGPDGTLYLRVVLDPASIEAVKSDAKNAIKTSLKNNEALYQQFVAKKGSHFKITKAGLKGKIIGVQRGTVAANFAILAALSCAKISEPIMSTFFCARVHLVLGIISSRF